MDDIIKALRLNNVKLLPLTEMQVRELETGFNIVFPEAYRQFLLVMGKSAGTFMQGSDAFYNNLININK